jgi:hypothetical protein
LANFSPALSRQKKAGAVRRERIDASLSRTINRRWHQQSYPPARPSNPYLSGGRRCKRTERHRKQKSSAIGGREPSVLKEKGDNGRGVEGKGPLSLEVSEPCPQPMQTGE